MDSNDKSPQAIDEEIFAAQNKTGNISKKIVLKTISSLHENLPISMTANFVCASVVYISAYTSQFSESMWVWYLATIFVSLLRITLPRFYLSYIKNPNYQLAAFQVGLVLTALLWGLAGSVLLPEKNMVHQMIVIIIVAGIVAGGVQTLQANYLSCFLLISIIILPLNIWIFQRESFAHNLLGISMATYLVSMLLIAYRNNRMLMKILTLHFENLFLVDNLSIANKKLHEYAVTTQKNEQMFRNILENAPIGMLITSPEGNCLQANFALTEMIGYPQSELKKLSIKDIIYPEDLAKDLDAEKRLMEGKLSYAQMEKRYVHKNGQLIWTIANISLISDNNRQPLYFIVQILDISERKRNEMKMVELNERTASTLSELRQRDIEMSYIKKMTDMLQICQDSAEAYAVIAKASQDLFPSLSGGFIIYDSNDLRMKTVQQWGAQKNIKQHFLYDDCWALRSGNTYVMNDSKKDLPCQHFESTPKGGYLCLPLIGHVGIIGMLVLTAASGSTINDNHKQLAATLSEIIKLFLANIQLRESLRDLSIHDPLTGLFNRRYLDDTLTRELAQAKRTHNTLCVAMMDLDYFKNFNDTYGHEAGDLLLKYIGKLLRENFRGSDLACRYGGEEFLIVFINSDTAGAVKRLEYICDKIRNTCLPFKDIILSELTVSVGIAQAPTDGDTPEDIISMADEALYTAKEKGRDRIEIYNKFADKKSVHK